jgi:predicted esterase
MTSVLRFSLCVASLLFSGALFTTLGLPNLALADEAWKPIPRALPPQGIEISAEDRRQLADELVKLQTQRASMAAKVAPESAPELIDVDIYLKAVQFALEEGEFFREKDVAAAHELLKTAGERLDQLADGKKPWASAKGLVVRGYRSAVDDSPQPYGLVIPQSLDLSEQVPLYVWLHGRNDHLCDLQFISERSRQPGQITPEDAIVLHPFGRSCLGWKSTAEIDVLEAIESVCDRYSIDRDRIVLLGFSMGGAGAWHIGAHYADRFAAIHAGAGFVDVKRYQNLTPDKLPPEYVQRMWGVYDVPGYVRNLFNLPVVAYSGELDKQKQAADLMAEAFHAEGQELTHLIGPKMGHKYDSAVLKDVLARMHAAVEQKRQPAARTVSLQTQTLRYNRMHWVEALGLDQHWQDSRIDAYYQADDFLVVETKNIQSMRLHPPQPAKIIAVDGTIFRAGDAPHSLKKEDGRWRFVKAGEADPPRKLHGQQGPIDDVLYEPFIVVTPTGTSSPQIDRWGAFELDHFLRRWKNVYRGVPRVVRDVDLTPADIQRYHLICFGDPASNSILRKVASDLPVGWKDGRLLAGPTSYDAATTLPLLIAPNPLNPEKYLVLNSGPTHREAHDRTNSLQNPQLGDWAIIDTSVAPTAAAPGRILAAGCFDEQWKFAEKVSPDETPAEISENPTN